MNNSKAICTALTARAQAPTLSKRSPGFLLDVQSSPAVTCSGRKKKKKTLMQINGNAVAGQQRGFPSQNQNKGFNLLSKSKARRHNPAISP